MPLCTPSDDIRYPNTTEQVVDIVKEAISRKVTVKAFGARHSQTDIICTEGIPVDVQAIQHFRMNDDGVTATFGSGVNLRDATQFLRQHKRGLRTTPAYGNITLGGAIGTGAHGSTIRYNASISSQVYNKILSTFECVVSTDEKYFLRYLRHAAACTPFFIFKTIIC